MKKLLALGIMSLILMSLFITAFSMNGMAIKSSLNDISVQHTGDTAETDRDNILDESGFVNDKRFDYFSRTLLNKLPKKNLDETGKIDEFFYVDGDLTRLVVGVDGKQTSSYEELEGLATIHKGKIVNTILIKDVIRAAVVELPLTSVTDFVDKASAIGLARYIEPSIKVQAQFVPNDPYWSSQWGPKKIQADWAWNTTFGDPSVLVAVVDTGIDWDHPDLAANYVPLGYDWTNNDPDPMDDHGHGTHVAGTIAAVVNNGVGVAGLAQVRIMGEKVLTSMGWGYWEWVAQGIVHATDQGADIISMSLGGDMPSAVVYEAVRYAYDAGVLVVAAAGNSNTDAKFYPAGYDEVIAVAATDSADKKASFSNYGDWIELAAPGVNIISTVWDDDYATFSGTSMATPHVSGVAALVLSKFPYISRDWMRLWLRQTADDLGTSGFDTIYGYGRINARKAVEQSVPEHDLMAYEWQTPAHLYPGNSSTINATVLNFGTSNETSVAVELLENGTLVGYKSVDFIAAGHTASVSILWSPSGQGIYNLTLYVVPVIGETKVDNNLLQDRIPVRYATTITVPDNYPTITRALDESVPGDTIFVRAGTYKENVVLNKEVQLIGENRATTIIDGGKKGSTVTVTSDGATLSGFTVKNSGGTSAYGSGVSLQEVSDFNITDNLIASNGYGVFLMVSYDGVLSGNNITGNTYAVRMYSSSNIEFSNNTVVSNYQGMLVEYSSGNLLSNNTLCKNGYGILLSFSSGNNVLSNIASSNNYGIRLDYSANNVLRENVLTANRYNFGIGYDFVVLRLDLSHLINDIDTSNLVEGKPVYYLLNQNNLSINPSTFPSVGYLALINSTNIVVENLTLTKNMQGLLLAYTHNSIVKGSTFTGNAHDGLMLYYSSNNTLSYNTMTNNYEGVFLDSSMNTVLSHNTITNHYYGNVLLDYSSNNVLTNNTVTNATLYGISLSSSDNNTLSSNVVRYNGFDQWNRIDGIRLHYSFNNILSNNLVTNNAYAGIRIGVSSNNTLSYNTATDNEICGIWVTGGSNNNILDNNIQNNWYGMWIDYSSNNVLSGNILADNSYNMGVSGSEFSHYIQEIDTSNLVNGKPMYYLKNQKKVVINSVTHPQIGYLALVNSTDVTLENLVLTKNTQGFLLAYSNKTSVKTLTVTNNFFGIRLAYSNDSTFIENTVTNNAYNVWLDYSVGNKFSGNNINNGVGVYLNLCSNNTLSANKLITNTGWYGIYLKSSYNNTVSGNVISNGTWFGGVRLEYSSGNLVIGNNITNNRYGITLSYSSNNSIFHNNFVNNTPQTYISPSGYGNTWDDGYPSGGNYWSNYAGSDNNGDGIGDTPYTINTDNQDRYPLMDPWVLNIQVDKLFSPSEMSAKRKGVLQSKTNVTNNGDADIVKLIYEDQILPGWSVSPKSRITVALFIAGIRYEIPYEELTYATTQDDVYTVQIDFNTGIDLYLYDPVLDQKVYAMTIYAFEPGWIVEFRYTMSPSESLLPSEYSSTVTITVTSAEGVSIKEGDTATLNITS